mgnify:CR=1 FL=1
MYVLAQTMSEQDIVGKLLEYGLSELEGKVYVYVAKKGPSPAGEIARSLSIRRGQTYNILNDLQKKGIVETVAGRPVRFSALPLPDAVDVLLDSLRQRERLMERTKPELLSLWQSALLTRREEVEEVRFQFLRGIEGIYRKTSEMIGASDRNVIMIVSEPTLHYADRFELFERMNEISRRSEVRVLLEVTPKIRQMVADLGKISAKGFSDYPSPNFLVVDGKQMIFLTTPMESVDSKETTAMWTNSPMLIRAMQHLFESTWSSARWISEVLVTPESGTTRNVSIRVRSERVKALQEEFAKYLSASGFDVRRDHMIIGSSGVEHIFCLALFRNGGKPVVIDVESSDRPVGALHVIRFFAKQLDVKNHVADTTLVVEPNLDGEARKLAAFYQIRFSELGPLGGSGRDTASESLIGGV